MKAFDASREACGVKLEGLQIVLREREALAAQDFRGSSEVLVEILGDLTSGATSAELSTASFALQGATSLARRLQTGPLDPQEGGTATAGVVSADNEVPTPTSPLKKATPAKKIFAAHTIGTPVTPYSPPPFSLWKPNNIPAIGASSSQPFEVATY
ncbi:hypothetical protein BD410DRAFT_846061 [Rickenella mellea]|uniref:Uncharacterized protein n=1 Tax=Rickenella mellea TaxID=50990 RepID=A0A4Y7PIZ5_9AGAM|nr:hypothetical protein BD410DRAFT_846061 [Rickenella mellea]